MALKRICRNEVFKTLILSTNGKSRIGKLIDTNTDEIFLPRPKVNLLVGKKKETKINLLVAKKITETSSRSFIFSKELLTAIREQVKTNEDKELLLYSTLIEALVKFGNRREEISPLLHSPGNAGAFVASAILQIFSAPVL